MMPDYFTRTRIGFLINLAWALGITALVAFYLIFSMFLREVSDLRQDESVLGKLYFSFPSLNIQTAAQGADGNSGVSSLWLVTFYALNKSHKDLYGIVKDDEYSRISRELNAVEDDIKSVFGRSLSQPQVDEISQRIKGRLVGVKDIIKGTYINVQVEREKTANRIHTLFSVLVGAFFVWMICGGLFAKELLLRPLKAIGREMKKLGVDLTLRLPEDAKGELGQFCLEVNRMAATLEQTHASRKDLEKEILRRMKLEEKVSAFFDQELSLHMMVEPEGAIIRINKAVQRLLFGTETEGLGQNLFEFVHQEDAEVFKDIISELGDSSDSYRMDVRFRSVEGPYRLLSCAINMSSDTRTIYIAALDVTDRDAVEESLRLSASVFTSATEGITITDKTGTIIDVNNAFSVITGYARDEIIGKNPRVLQSGLQDKNFYKNMWSCIAEQGFWRGEVWNRRKNGELFPQLLTISAVRDESQEVSHYIGMFSDISRIKQNETKLQHLAHFDALTGLPNRVLLSERIREKLKTAKSSGLKVAVAFIDLDDFKAVNDELGHETGDQLLVAVAERLAGSLRDNDTLARIGGDEFVVVIGNVDDKEEAELVFERLLTEIQEPFDLLGGTVNVTASIGIAFFDNLDDIDSGVLLRRADMAMYRAKLFGRNCCFYFNPEEDTELQRSSAMVRDVEAALDNDEFVLFYQPKVDLRSGEIIDVEALIRWRKPTGEIIPPGSFLPMIEDDDIIIKIGDRVIEKAFEQLAAWDKEGIHYGISVNIAARQLQYPEFARRFEELIANQPPKLVKRLEIEVLETTAIEVPEIVTQQMQKLIELGVNFSLDDFGTGYSSLTYLRELPVSKIKIDQGFIRSILQNKSDQKIFDGAVSLGKSFGLDVVAEGVETEAHGYWLLEHGCHLAQGYAICRPLPEGEFMDWRETWMSNNPWNAELKQAHVG